MMADKEEKKDVGAKEEKKAKKGNGGIIKILVIVVLLLAVGGGGAFAGYSMYKSSQEPKPITEIKVEALKDLTVNLSDEGTPRYVKTSVTISYDEKDSKAAEEITAKTPEINDKITFFLKSRKFSSFESLFSSSPSFTGSSINALNSLDLIDCLLFFVMTNSIISNIPILILLNELIPAKMKSWALKE